MNRKINEIKQLKKQKKKTELEYGILTVFAMLTVLLIMSIFTGKSIFAENEYNTYALQADSWRQGRLDLGQDYPWLEIASFEGKYYCSFPPFPSYVLFPLTFIFHSNTPDGLIMLILAVLSMAFLYKTALKVGVKPQTACIGALFFSMCTNYVFLFFNPMVWFMAQSMCFTLSVIACYAAITQRGMLALFLWACSVGCRPMQITFLPVILLILYIEHKNEHPSESLIKLIKQKWYWSLPCLAVAVSYMILNYLRFGSITEFGHNYLPEFMYKHKQFSPEYLSDNFKSLMHLPELSNGKIVIDSFGNFNIFVLNPAVLFFMATLMISTVKKRKQESILAYTVLICCVGYLIFTMMHATMGGWHFGNRYFVDCIPWLFIPYVYVIRNQLNISKWQIPFFIWGLCLNVLGAITVYNR